MHLRILFLFIWNIWLTDINLKYREYATQLPCIKKNKRNRENCWLIHVNSINRSRQGNTLNFCKYWNWHNFSKNIITNIFPFHCLLKNKNAIRFPCYNCNIWFYIKLVSSLNMRLQMTYYVLQYWKKRSLRCNDI